MRKLGAVAAAGWDAGKQEQNFVQYLQVEYGSGWDTGCSQSNDSTGFLVPYYRYVRATHCSWNSIKSHSAGTRLVGL